jgi:hypothetical protein
MEVKLKFQIEGEIGIARHFAFDAELLQNDDGAAECRIHEKTGHPLQRNLIGIGEHVLPDIACIRAVCDMLETAHEEEVQRNLAKIK